MNEQDSERLDAISRALARLDARQEEILKRLERLEAAAGVAPAAAPEVQAKEPEREPEPAGAAPRPRGFETRMGLTLVNRVGVVTLVLGAAFFFRYAVEAGWLGIGARVLLGAVAGLGALALAERVRRGGHHVYAMGLAGAGIGILYLTVYAASGLYGMVGQGPGFLMMAAVTAAAVALALRHDSEALAALGLFGGYITPLLLSPDGQAWFVLCYALLLGGGALYAVRLRGWTVLEPLVLLGTVWVYGSELDTPVEAGRRAFYTTFALAFYGLFTAFPRRWLGVVGQVLAALALAIVWGHTMWPFAAVALALAGAGLAVADRRGWPLAVPAGFWLSYALWVEAEQRAVGPVFWFLTAAFVLMALWLPWRTLAHRRAGVQDLVLAALNAGIYFAVAYGLLAPLYSRWAGPLAVVLAAVHLGMAWALWKRDGRAALLAAGTAWALLVLAAPAQFAGYRVTMVWALEGAALAWIGARLREPRAGWGAAAIFVLVLWRLLAVDAWAYGASLDYAAVLNARFLTFLLAALCLWAAAKWSRARPVAGAAYIAGHVVLLWGLGMEALGWAARTAPPGELRSVASTALSIVLGAYAVALVSLGVFTGTLVNRLLGLGLIGLVVAKLYLHDVWFLGLFYRMAAFAVLGALLLAMSYLYSRYRAAIETWWRERR